MTWSPAIRELLAIHEIFRRLGFLPRDLYVDIFPNGCGHPPPCKGIHAQFALRIGGNSTEPLFRIDINEDCSDVDANWGSAATWWNTASTNEERIELYENTWARRSSMQLLMALSKKGLITNPNDAVETV